MGESSSIEWTDATWNPWTGCTKVSLGCKNCYAERITEKRGEDFRVVRRTKTMNDPLRWKQPRMIFTCSMSDFFHEAADPWRDEAWEMIRRSPQHIFQILTKRPERISEHLPGTCFYCGVHEWAQPIGVERHALQGWPWPNCWLGVSVETQKYAEERIPKLIAVPAVVHFLSCEPLLGPIDFSLGFLESISEHERRADSGLLNDIEWVITGGESDYANPRPSNPDWFRHIRAQCVTAGVPFFHKQNGGTTKCRCHGSWGCRLLDGKEYNAMPEVRNVGRS